MQQSVKKTPVKKVAVKRLAAVIAILCSLSACTIGPQPVPGDPEYAPVLPFGGETGKTNPGGIFQVNYVESLYSDRRAARVGDIITVMLNERTAAKKSGSTTVTKENDLDFNAGTLLGKDAPSYQGVGLDTAVTQNRDFTGESEADQTNSLSGSIAVTVAEVLPNGLLVVRGEKWMTLNQGEEFIRLRGIIRQEDISPNNTISSTKLADARIAYSGTGALAKASEMGWASKFFNSHWWPF